MGLRLSDVSVRLGDAGILHGISLEAHAGEWLGLVGPNGAGKTTILSCVAGLVEHTGTLAISGAPAGSMSSRERAQRVALVPQRPMLPSGMTVAEYVLLGRTPYIGYFDIETRRDRDVAAWAMERLGVTRFAGRRLGALSGGEQQRVVLARALTQQPRILLLDEGTSALDIGAQQEVLELVDALRAAEGLTVLSAMHDLTFAAQYAQRLALISGGRLVTCGPPEMLSPELIFEHYRAYVVVNRHPYGVVVSPARHRHERQGANGT